MSWKRKNRAETRAKKAALLFVACERNPDPTGWLRIPNILRVKGSEDKAVDCTLQMQVRREFKKLKRKFICLSRSNRNDHVSHDNDDHNDNDHSNNDQSGPSVPTEENVQNKPPASNWTPEGAEGKGGLCVGSGTSHDTYCHWEGEREEEHLPNAVIYHHGGRGGVPCAWLWGVAVKSNCQPLRLEWHDWECNEAQRCSYCPRPPWPRAGWQRGKAYEQRAGGAAEVTGCHPSWSSL